MVKDASYSDKEMHTASTSRTTSAKVTTNEIANVIAVARAQNSAPTV